MFFEYIYISIISLYKKRSRTLLLMLGIFIGVASVSLIFSIGEAGKNTLNNELNKFGLSGINIQKNTTANTNLQLTKNELQLIQERVFEVDNAMPIIANYGTADINNTKTACVIFGIGANAKDIISLNTIYGDSITKTDISLKESVCLVDDSFALEMYKRENIVGKELKLSLNGQTYKLKISGIVKSQNNVLKTIAGQLTPAFVYLPYTTLQTILQNDEFSQIALKIKENENLDLVGKKVINMLSRANNSKNGYNYINMAQQKEKIEYLGQIFTLILTSIAAISLLVGGLSIMNVMLVSVNERIYEIGIKKAVGASKTNIMCEFLTESVIITLTGGILGAITGGLTAYLGAFILGIPYTPELWIFAVSIGFALVVGVIFGVYPAKIAAELDPIKALHHD